MTTDKRCGTCKWWKRIDWDLVAGMSVPFICGAISGWWWWYQGGNWQDVVTGFIFGFAFGGMIVGMYAS